MQMTFEKSNVPSELVKNALWCCWNYEERKGKPTKAPKNPKTGGNAQSNNPDTFTDFSTAYAAYQSGKFCGLGIGIFPPFAAVDIDHCIEDGVFSDMAADIIATMHSYTEISPSGSGIRVFFTIDKDFSYDKEKFYIMNQKIGLEIYVSGCTSKFCTITGKRLNDFPLSDGTESLTMVLEKFMRRKPDVPALPDAGFQLNFSEKRLTADDVIRRAQMARNADKFQRLFSGDFSEYGSQSEADAALCAILAHYTDDTGVIDEVFRRSGLMREKWDRAQSGSSYGRITIANALAFQHDHTNDGLLRDSPQTKFTKNERAVYIIEKTLNIDTELIERLAALNPMKYHHSDRGSAEMFADVFRRELRYNVTSGDWLHYDGTRWVQDARGMIAHQLAKGFFDALMHLASSIKDERLQNDFREFYSKLGGKNKRDILLKDAADNMFIAADELDKDANLLNLQNGTLELDTLTFREHRPEDFITKSCGCEYHPEIHSDVWEKFTQDVIPHDIEKLEFLQKAAGRSLLGKPLERFYILYGKSTRNGKSTFLETISTALGDYARGCEPETLSQRKNRDSRAPSEDLARLAGCRFLRVSEPPQSLIFDAALVKKLTGGDAITARFLNQGSFEFIPQFTLFMNTNYLPRVLDETLFSSGRVNVIEFSRHFSEKEQDTTLKSRLRTPENLSGVFSWLLDGLRMYREQGLEMPSTVELETNSYRTVSDKLTQFIDDLLEPTQGAAISAKTVYESYKLWCQDSGFSAENKSRFFEKLRSRGLMAESGTIDGKTVRNVISGYKLYFDNIGQNCENVAI